jgi:hypothetical protein
MLNKIGIATATGGMNLRLNIVLEIRSDPLIFKRESAYAAGVPMIKEIITTTEVIINVFSVLEI